MPSHSDSPLLLTLGEPAGIGPDCTLLAFQDNPAQFEKIIVVAPKGWLEARAGRLGIDIDLHDCRSLGGTVPAGKLGFWNPLPAELSNSPVTAGRPSQDTASAVIGCIEAAALACLRGEANGMVTAPIEKAVLRQSGFNFPGHTEFLAAIARRERVVMMLASEELHVALLTTHMALADVPASLDVDGVTADLTITWRDMRQRFGIESPRLALCGLNPHAGEQGHFGDEEQTILAPAVALAREAGIMVDGPLPADTLFSPQMREQYDAIVCCYHDQALIPIKALSFGEAVNVTLGLPFIRTSVDHGTATDRAGTGKVSYSSLMCAIEMAREMGRKTASAGKNAD